MMLLWFALGMAFVFGWWLGSQWPRTNHGPSEAEPPSKLSELHGWKLKGWERHNGDNYTLCVRTPAGYRWFRGSCTVWHDVESKNYDRPETDVEKWLCNHWRRIQDTEADRERGQAKAQRDTEAER